MAYINVPIVTEADVLVQQSLASISANIPGWIPREGNLEVLLLEQFAAMSSEAANVASNVPDSIFQYFGSLIGIVPNAGLQNQLYSTWTLVSNAPAGGYQIAAGTIVGVFYAGASYQFQTVNPLTISAGTNSTAGVLLEAVTTGAAYNIQSFSGFGANVNSSPTPPFYMQLQTQDANISSVVITGTPANNSNLVAGTDPESTDAFLSRLTAELQLLAPRPITPSDYALFAQNVSGIYRAQAFDGFNSLTNLFSAANANFTTASTSGSTPSGWGVVGNGTVTAGLPTLSTPGTAPSNYLQFTSTSTALVSAATVQTATIAKATSLIVTVGTGPSFSTTISSVAPALIMITDSTNGNEIAVVTAASATTGSGSATQQTLTIASPGLAYAHTTSATVKQLQAASAPVASSLYANSYWYQAASVIKAAGSAPATTATEKPYIVAVATYIDGSVQTFSSLPTLDDSLYTYTSNSKVVTCNIASTNANSTNVLASDPSVTTIYTNANPSAPRPYVTSIQMYIAFSTTETSKTHTIPYVSLNEVQLDLTTAQSPTLTTSNYNFIPDATFLDYEYSNGYGSSWTNPNGTVILPGTGVQYQGTGSALGSSLTVSSQAFNLSHLVSDTTSTSRVYTLFATVNATYAASSTYSNISIQVVNVATSAVIATVSPSAAAVVTLPIQFTLAAPADVQVNIVFGTGLNVPLGSSVIVSNVAVVSGAYTLTNLPALNQYNYTWTPGGLYNPNTYNYPRTVSVVPTDANGLPVAPSIAQNLSSYLATRRETNFTVNSINPNYVPIDVQYTIYVSPAYTTTAVQTSVNSAIRSFLSPATWAGGTNSPPYWNGAAVSVNVMDLASIIGQVAGVSNVVSVGARTSYPTGGTYLTTTVPLVGIAPLPIANTITPTVYANPSNTFTGL